MEDLFKGFTVFKKVFISYLLIIIFTLLWTLLFIIPGIIATISYAMTFYILADNNDISGQDALKKSKELIGIGLGGDEKKGPAYMFANVFILCDCVEKFIRNVFRM